MDGTRTYRFSITVTAEPDQKGYDDPEWIADAAWGTLTNEYGYECTFGDISELPADATATAPSDVAEP
jgi:hypothetical protein